MRCTALLASALLVVFARAQTDNTTDTILANAEADNIDLSAVPNYDSILADIADVATSDELVRREARDRRATTSTTPRIDVHTHIVPDWYQAINPTTGGNPTPNWTMSAYLDFMASENITRSIFSFSTPGANVFMGNKAATVALARIINEASAAFARANPSKLSFYAVVPLPYVDEAITEMTYVLDRLGAVGISLYSNHESVYLGNPIVTPFFRALNNRGGKNIVSIHPNLPLKKINNQIIEANPTIYPSGHIEFFFETARVMHDLALTQTMLNFTTINFVIPHVGGAWPSVWDRLMKMNPTLYTPVMNAIQTRFWFDSAGSTFYHQVAGLLAYGVPPSRLLFGTDFPYAQPSIAQMANLNAVLGTTYITPAQVTDLFSTNPMSLYAGKINF